MSLWPGDQVVAWLAPSGVVLARMRGRGSRERVLAQVGRAVEPVHDLGDWTGCAAALEAELERTGWHRAALRACVSDHFVRYALLPWREGLRGSSEWDAYARYELEARFGATTKVRAIRIAPARPGCSRLAAAIDAGLIAAFQRIASALRLELTAIEPNVCRVANRFRRTLPKSGGTLVISEPGRLSLLQSCNDDWVGMQSVRAGASPVETVVSLVLQARTASDAACRQVMVWGELPDDTGSLVRHGIEATRLGPAAMLPEACLPLGLI